MQVLQRLGRTVETRDDQFERCLQRFNDQQTDGNRIYKDLRNYISAVRDMREASRRLSQSLFDVYESDWAGEEDLGAIVEGEDLLWNDYEVKLLDQAVRNMESYVGQFPDLREKIAKRGRKLVDYDFCSHHLEALQTAKKRDDVKINKAQEERNYAKNVYEFINNELKEELPVLYDSRIGCYVTVFSALSALRDTFYKEMNTLNFDLLNVMRELQAQHPDKVFSLKGMQRYGSLKRRSLMSPRAWKTSFSEFHRSYSPKNGQRFSLKSPDKPRRGTLSRESSTHTVSSQSPPVGSPIYESGDPDAEASHGETPSFAAQEETVTEQADDSTQVEEEKVIKEEAEPKPAAEPDNRGDGERASPRESGCGLSDSCDSESLEVQLSAADDGPLHIEETDESPGPAAAPQPNPLENGLCGAETQDRNSPHKVQDAPAENAASLNSKSTEV
ncbi:bridging integrator 2a isoform X2 [Betta splendens]|uniref:Bridging integrator 2a isoform X2 n=1 Tax=Betta splendens TaxID=158456 RepID=A0A9W2XWX3_BETSP|nr:bridging integrator 2a isoform X2 [Betta splendens]